MRQKDIKKGYYYSHGKSVRVVAEIEDHYGRSNSNHPTRVKYLSAEGASPSFPYWCDLQTFAKWAKKRVVPVWVDASPCPDCGGWCDQVTTMGSLDNNVDLECSACGLVCSQG